LEQLANVRKSEVMQLHGIGKNALKTLQQVLDEHGLSFASDDA